MSPETAIVEACRKYGSHPIAFSTLQPDVQYFQHGDGYIPFRVSKFWHGFPKAAFTLGDPICPEEAVGETIDAFLAEHPRTCFCQVFNQPTLKALSERGFYINEFGIETMLDLKSHDFRGQSSQTLRTTRNHAEMAEIKIMEAKMSDIDTKELTGLSSGWIGSKMSYEDEITFLARPLPEHDEDDVRNFYAFDRTGKLAGFVVFDPIYNDGKVIGYSADILRDRPVEYEHPEQGKRPLPGLLDHVIMHAFEKFQAENNAGITARLKSYGIHEDKTEEHRVMADMIKGKEYEKLQRTWAKYEKRKAQLIRDGKSLDGLREPPKEAKIPSDREKLVKKLKQYGFSESEIPKLVLEARLREKGIDDGDIPGIFNPDIETLALGFSPFYKVKKPEDFRASSFTTWFCQFNYSHMNHVYNYKGLSFHKERWKGNEGKVYFCSKKKMSLLQILTLYGACDLHPIKKMITNPLPSAWSNWHMTKGLVRNGFFLFH